MLESFKIFIINISIIIVFVKIIEMILPEGNLNKYIKFVVGIITIIVIISPVIQYFNKNIELNIRNVDEYYESLDNINSDNSAFDEVQKRQVLGVYKQNLEDNVVQLIGEVDGYVCEKVECDIKDNNEEGQINKIIVYMEKNKNTLENSNIKKVNPIEINNSKESQNNLEQIPKNIQEQIINKLVSTYNLKQEQVEVR